MKRYPVSAHNKQLCDLPPGARFALDYTSVTGFAGSPTAFGTVLDTGVGSVPILLDAGVVLHSIMDRATGEEVGTLGKGRIRQTRWAPETRVVWLDDDPNNSNSGLFSEGQADEPSEVVAIPSAQGGATSMSVDQKTKASILARWDFQNKRYFASLAKQDEEGTTKAEERMAAISVEANDAGVELPDYDGGDEQEEQGEAEVEVEALPPQTPVKGKAAVAKSAAVAVATPAVTVSKGAQLKAANAARLANLDAAKKKAPKAAGAAKAAKTSTPKVAKEPKPLNDCLDGCGAKVKGNFAMGHDAKLKSLILKVERGEKAQSEIPDVAQDLIKFRKGEVMEEVIDGKKVRTQLFECTQSPVKLPGRAA